MADDAATKIRSDETECPLWPEGAPGGFPDVPPETAFQGIAGGGPLTRMLRNVSAPSLTDFEPDPAKANGTGVIICPGGGWRLLAWEHEGVDLARWFAAHGYAAFVLKYRLAPTPADPAHFDKLMARMSASVSANAPAAKAPRALAELMNDDATAQAREMAAEDGRRALAIVRERAPEWCVKPDRIGMVGFSAGAFLTADVAMDPGGPPLAFAAPIYGGETRGRPVPADAPPLFTAIAQDDRILFKVVEGLYADWSNADRPAELHIFRRGGHGFGMVGQNAPVDRWIDLLEAWLADLGYA